MCELGQDCAGRARGLQYDSLFAEQNVGPESYPLIVYSEWDDILPATKATPADQKARANYPTEWWIHQYWAKTGDDKMGLGLAAGRESAIAAKNESAMSASTSSVVGGGEDAWSVVTSDHSMRSSSTTNP